MLGLIHHAPNSGRLDELVARLQTLDSRMEVLEASNHPLRAEASALSTELDVLRAWHPLFSRLKPGAHASLAESGSPLAIPYMTESQLHAGKEQAWGVGQPGQGPPPPQLPSGEESHVHGRDTADLFHYFNQAGSLTPSVAGQVRCNAWLELM
jgi:hypothetical protein